MRSRALHRPALMAFCSALFGFAFYGGWGYWVNLHHGSSMALTVLWAQGSYSFILTLCMTLLIETLYTYLHRWRVLIDWPNYAKDWLSILVTCAIVFSGSWWINVVAGTPEIFKTVILGYVFGGLYTLAYVFGLSRRSGSTTS